MFLKWLAPIIGYIYAIFVGWFFTRLISDRMWESINWKKREDIRPHPWQPQLVGIMERILYVASLQVGKAEFIGIWLALKVAGQWSRWSNDPEKESGIPQGRLIYQVFLIGNSFSILYALLGFKIIEWIISGQWQQAVIIPVVLIIFTFLIWVIIPKSNK